MYYSAMLACLSVTNRFSQLPTTLNKCRSLTIEQVRSRLQLGFGVSEPKVQFFLLKLNLNMDCEITSLLKLKPKPGLRELLSLLKIGTCS
jgi:hypothetical protein